MYKKLIRPILFMMNPEKVHHLSFKLIRLSNKLGLPGIFGKSIQHKNLERTVFGINFPNPVGLAAGFDKDAKLYRELSNFGFGFIEIGTVTPRPQAGNEKPRLFRLKEDQAVINRMGFNNGGVQEAVNRLKNNRNTKQPVIIGGNIGKNKDTPNEKAGDDYLICFNALYDYVDYFVVNVSSPNTPNLRALQEKEPLMNLLNLLQQRNMELAKNQKPKPILLKIAPDLTDSQLLDIIDIVQQTKIDGVIATNTTIGRDGLKSSNKKETGGLSGKPLSARSTEVIRFLSEKSNKSFPIIGVGGIHETSDALEKLNAGASLIQLYTGFIYEGPALIKKINQELLKAEHT